MRLTLKDRVLILNSVLPRFDTRKNMESRISIAAKIAIGEDEWKRVTVTDAGGGQVNISFADERAVTEESDFSLTDGELDYLKRRVDIIDRNGMFSEFTMPTYVKITDEPYADPDYGKEAR